MKLLAFLSLVASAAALPALAATGCPAPQVLVGSNCTLTSVAGWATAGAGTQTLVTLFVPPGASGSVRFEITALSSSLGSAYTGYFGIMAGAPGQPGQVFALADILNNQPGNVGPGQQKQFVVTQVCFDPTCTAVPPAAFTGPNLSNMFSMQFVMSSPNPADIQATPNPLLTIQFLNGSQVTFEEQENAQRRDAPFAIIPGISLGATPAGRYVLNGTAYTEPFDVLSVSNINNPNPTNGTATLQDSSGNTIFTAPIPPIPPGGAAGFLVIGRFPGDPIGLFQSTTVLPAHPDGLFHGILVIGMNGLSPTGFNIVLAQEFNGNAFLNLPVFGSPVP